MEGEVSVPASVPPAGSVPTAGHSPITSGPMQRLVYDGRLGELYRIFIVNLLLGLVTLGVYRFWGKTRIRRYLLSRLSYDGDRFEYTGTGGELFRGFLVVAAVLFVVGLAFGILQLVLETTMAQDRMRAMLAMQVIYLIVYIVIFYLLMVGQYMALRYRLSRSRWRGIRGGLAGSPWAYGGQAFAWTLAIAASLGFAKPVADVTLWRVRLRNLFFGTAQAKLAPGAETKGLYGPYVAGWFATMIGVVIFYAALIGAIVGNLVVFAPYATPGKGEFGLDIERMLRDPGVLTFLLGFVVGLILFGSVIWTVVTFFRSWYLAVLINRLGHMTELAGLHFAPGFTMRRLGWLLASNMLIGTVTLGLGLPVVLHRTWRFLADNLQIVGSVDGAGIGQSQQYMPGRGEGLLDALDAGGAF